jgi:hypothetical protein
MRKHFFGWLCLALLSGTAALAQSQQSPSIPNPFLPYLSFVEAEHSAGSIPRGAVVEHTFKFTNTGKTPLLIANVRTTCGCTATEWTRTPVAPGESGVVKARFDSTGKSGPQHKVITVISNAANDQLRLLLRANVVATTP